MNTSQSFFKRTARILLVALFSDSYPAIGESHGVSVLAGCLENAPNLELEALKVVDMYALESNNRDAALLQITQAFRPTIVGISVSYGGYGRLKVLYPELKRLLKNREHLVIFGGPLPTYLPEIFLRQIDKTAIVVQGEGDEAIVQVARSWLNQTPLEAVPNICYLHEDEFGCHERTLVDVRKVPPPYRSHIGSLARNKAQIFVESSRGCSWATCTFCPRGLVDVKGTTDEYRRFPIDRLARDLAGLRDKGVRAITFADEDLLGGAVSLCEQFVSNLEMLKKGKILQVPFDASMTVKSLYSTRWSKQERIIRKNLLTRLKDVGLRKVFLGVESGSPTQLARYGKGYSPLDGAGATQLVRSLGVSLEIGFIMFDPLCTLTEVEENISFLNKHDLAAVASSLGSGLELRLQFGARYLNVLSQAEQEIGLKLFSQQLDPDTLVYASNYLDPDVGKVVSMVRTWNSLLRPLYYPLKSLSRYGTGGILQRQALPLRELLAQTRQTYLNRIWDAVQAVRLSGDVTRDVIAQFRQDLQHLSMQILIVFERCSSRVRQEPIVASVLDTAKAQASLV